MSYLGGLQMPKLPTIIWSGLKPAASWTISASWTKPQKLEGLYPRMQQVHHLIKIMMDWPMEKSLGEMAKILEEICGPHYNLLSMQIAL